MNLEHISRFAQPMSMTAAGYRSLISRPKYSTEEAKHFAAKRLPKVNGAIAMIPVHGTLAYFDDPWYGVTSMPRLGRVIDAAMAMKEIKAIFYDFNTPGGTVAGTPEFGAKIFSYRGMKPQIAVANPEAASAGIWTATAADQLIVTPSGEVGSIGVWTMHVDQSEMLEEIGLKVTLKSAGKYKVEGHPFGPLTEEAGAEMQRSVDESYKEFVSSVAKHRGVSPETVRKDYGEGRMLGAKKAVEVGLADRVETLEGVLTAMRAEHKGNSRADRELAEVLASEFDRVDDVADDRLDDDELQIALAERG